ncbi:HET-domain-containing protein [Lepidopterella palustris CBS 459.81]|uniref:HET-domain-containing protein n=1 Tax=Lepidopterella palustris CBS 459.81 TaxID=1314670 RepID=A0A8E2E493_9PEZI|nr:HET-domain-containing protein [Lepidopterella palustris CBS 459.81]
MIMSEHDDISLETDVRAFVGIFPVRFLTYSRFALYSIFWSKFMLVCYGVAWFAIPSMRSTVFWAYQVYFISCLDDVRKFGRVLFLALFGALPWDRVLFGLIHTGLPLTAYFFSAMICNQVLQKPSLLWTVGWEYLNILFLALNSTFLAFYTWHSVHASVREHIKHVLPPFRQTGANMIAFAMSSFVFFCRGRGYFLIFWWRIWERRADRQYDDNLARIQSQRGLEAIRNRPSESLPFEYKRLEKDREIRLLEVSMGPSRDIKANMVHVDVDNPGEYSAISYTWVNMIKSHGIVIDEAWMATTASVYEVIFKNTPITGTKRLWIDFVCINQDDNHEKSKQVRLMRDIYSSANKVIACLGNVNNEIADITEHYLHKIYVNRKQLFKQSRLSRILTQQRKILFNVRNPQWAAMSNLMNHPYWTRVWIIQEIANAKRLQILFGDRELSWDALRHLVFSTLSSPDTDPLIDVPELVHQEGENPLRGMNRIYLMMCTRDALRGDSLPPMTLKDVLRLSTRFNASDERDRVFALQGVLVDEVDKELLPDYTIGAEELFKRVARHLLHQDDPLWMFAHAGISQPRALSSLPSWVPDWSTLRWMVSIDRLSDGYGQAMKSVGLGTTLSRAQSLSVANGILQVEVVALGSILVTAPIPMLDEVPDFIPKINRSVLDMQLTNWLQVRAIVKLAIPDPYMTREPRDEALWRMLLGYTGTDAESMAKVRMFFEAWEKSISMPSGLLTHLEHDKKQIQKSKHFLGRMKMIIAFCKVFSEYLTASNIVNASGISNRIGTRCTGRVVAVTDSGYMALVPKGTQSNDKIYLMAGANSPYVIRDDSYLPSSPILSRTRRSLHFRLVGDAYLRGFPLRLEISPRDSVKGVITSIRRDMDEKGTTQAVEPAVVVQKLFDQIQQDMLDRARMNYHDHIKCTSNWDEVGTFLNAKNVIWMSHCGSRDCAEAVQKETAELCKTAAEVDPRAPSMGAKDRSAPIGRR